ncbi:MAG: hypothetical protein ACLQKK_20965 [Rhodomicrobium sp.]
MVRKSISIAVITALMASSAEAALLTEVQGMVTVNHGEGYSPAGAGGEIAPGDRVRAAAGSASIVYENGCTQKVEPNQTVIVLYAPPACKVESQGFSTLTYVGGGVLLAGGAAAAVALSQNGSKPASP